MRTNFHRIPTLTVILVATLACTADGPTIAAPPRVAASPSFARHSESSTFSFSLECRKDASVAGNLGLNVYNSAFQPLYNGAFFCGQGVTVGPGAAWVHYNINVYDAYEYLFSCESGTPGATYVPVVAGKVRCVEREASFLAKEHKGIWVSLTVKAE